MKIYLKNGHEVEFEDVEPEFSYNLMKIGDKYISLSTISSYQCRGKEYFVYTGKEYVDELRVDYEAFCDESDKVPFDVVGEDTEWGYGKKLECYSWVICDSMLEVYNLSI